MPIQIVEARPGKPGSSLPYSRHPWWLAGAFIVLLLCCVVPLSRTVVFWDMEHARTFMGEPLEWGVAIWAGGNIVSVLVSVPLAVLFAVKEDLHPESKDDRWFSVLGIAVLPLFLTVIGFVGET